MIYRKVFKSNVMAKCVLCGKTGLFLKTNVEGMCPKCQAQTLNDLRAALSPEQKQAAFLEEKIKQLAEQIKSWENSIDRKKQQYQALEDEIQKTTNQKKQLFASLDAELQRKKTEIIETDETALLQSFGFYKPRYDFVNSEAYKNRLDAIRAKQKALIKENAATTGYTNWTVDGSASKGKTMISNMQKLLLRAFNSECDEIIDRVKYSNFEASIKRIQSSKDAISKLGAMMGITITDKYYNSKIEELTLAFEYQQMKQKEKEEQRELKAQMREEARLQKELEAERKFIEKEQNHYLNALEKIKNQLSEQPENQELLARKTELEIQLSKTAKSLKDIDYREANKRAGYVYVISNIGAFGENVYKIGMTRRLDPQERIDELGDASVPFDFDVHAMIFSDDAPRLENALHHAFEHRRLNKVNTRREFFNVTLEEIKTVVRQNYDKTAEFVDLPEAEQYRVSQKM